MKSKDIGLQFVSVLLVKISFLLLFPWSNEFYKSSIAYAAGDTFSYYPPLESLLNNGHYFDDFRMPGLAFPYLFLRFLMNETMALNALVIIQVFFSAISVILLAKITLILTGKKSLYYWVLALYGLSTFVTKYDNVLLTESLFTSTLILVVYLLIQEGKKRFLIIGLLLAWMVFLKPISILLIPIIISVFIYKEYKTIRKFDVRIALIAAPILLLLSVWVLRNYKEHNRFFLLTKSVNYPSVESSYLSHAYEFVASFGGSCVYWKPKAEITFFYKASNSNVEECHYFPNYIYTSKFNRDSLLDLKQLIQKIDDSKDLILKETLNGKAEKAFDRYKQSIIDEKPFLYHVGSRFLLLKSFLIHPGTMNLFLKASNKLTPFELLVKIGYSLVYLFSVFAGFLGILFFSFRKKQSNLFWLILPATYFALIYPLVMRMDEFRYYVPAYPFMLVLGFLFVNHFVMSL